ncbi:MAG: PilZ domain-containing protein [Myxococcales bacterium]|nr:PilZ domain-containing protein [Myxococcales bacterium]
MPHRRRTKLHRLLLVLPPDGTRTHVVHLLRQHFPISVTTDIDDVAQVIQEDPTFFDLVLVDDSMGATGVSAVARAIRVAAPTRRVPVVVISNDGTQVPMGTESGVVRFVGGQEQPWEMLVYHINAALFPRERDERASPRVLLRAPAIVAQADDEMLTGEVFNISLGGLFVRTKDRAPLGAQVSIRFPLPSADEPVVVVGEVVRVVEPRASDTGANVVGGVGVRFLAMDRTVRRQIATFVVGRAPSSACSVEPLRVTRDPNLNRTS